MSSTNSNPEFRDPLLRDTFKRVGPAIELYTKNLDALSADIKTLEGVLDKSGIRIVHEVDVDRQGLTPEEVEQDIAQALNCDSRYHGFREALRWAKAPQSSQWRIVWKKLLRTWDDMTPDDGPWNQQEQLVDERPLIETPIPIRLRAYRHVPALLEKIGETVAVAPLFPLTGYLNRLWDEDPLPLGRVERPDDTVAPS